MTYEFNTIKHDLASLLIRKMKNGKWDLDSANDILQAYDSCYNLVQSDIPVMADWNTILSGKAKMGRRFLY